MKVVILAGGLGTRISEYTKTIPKPMIKINGEPIILHIMKHYAKFGFEDFYIALGYKGNVIRKYFEKKNFGWNINLIDTGKHTMTGGRLKKLKKYLKKETFMMTYGDGVSNVNFNKLLKFHKKGYDYHWDISQRVKGKNIQFVKLIPTKEDGDIDSLLLGIDTQKNHLYKLIEVGENGTVTTLTINQMKVDGSLSENFFVFNLDDYPNYYINN